ncbi:hypothetical protein ACVI1I_006378 [Bradyrhizobium sp. USDA 4459]
MGEGRGDKDDGQQQHSTSRHHGAAKHGNALLAGMIRCRRCGRKLTLRYTGAQHGIPRYSCSRAWMDNGEPRCIAFGSLRVDDSIEEALLGVVGPGAITAAVAAERQAGQRRDQVREALLRDLEAAPYAADRAFRQYDAADPANRLVAGELEARWNKALARVAEVESKIARHGAAMPMPAIAPTALAALATDLKTVWAAPTTDARLKKRIVRTLIQEVVADIDQEAGEIVLIVHWIGGVHSQIRLPKRRRGQRNSASADVITAVRQLVLIANDDLIAGTLNRNGLVTGHGNRWTRERVTSLRSHHRIPVFKPADDGIEPWLNLSKAARLLKIAPKTSDWRRRPARSPPCIPCPKALGSLPVPISRHQPHKQSQNARAKIQNTPRDRIPISKISLLQPHRQMGVVMQDCSRRPNWRFWRGHHRDRRTESR